MITIVMFVVLYLIAAVLVGYMAHESSLFMLKYNKLKAKSDTEAFFVELGHYTAVVLQGAIWPIVLLVETINIGK